MGSLKELGLFKNCLTALPDSFCQLSALQKLGLDDNNLSRLPKDFGKLSALKMMSLENHSGWMLLPSGFAQLAIGMEQLSLSASLHFQLSVQLVSHRVFTATYIIFRPISWLVSV